jgi:hypothetical protein
MFIQFACERCSITKKRLAAKRSVCNSKLTTGTQREQCFSQAVRTFYNGAARRIVH